MVRFIGHVFVYTDLKIKNKEAHTMKRTKKYPHLSVVERNQPKYPNAADHRYFAAKALNLMTALVSGMGLVSAMLFLVTMA